MRDIRPEDGFLYIFNRRCLSICVGGGACGCHRKGKHFQYWLKASIFSMKKEKSAEKVARGKVSFVKEIEN